MLWMHISVTVALLVFLGMIPAMIDIYPPRPRRLLSLSSRRRRKGRTLGLFSLIYVLFCVRSFIAARRSRLA